MSNGSRDADGSASQDARPDGAVMRHGVTNAIVRTFLNSNLALILIVLAAILGFAALFVTPREEDPQIVVPLADVFVRFPGHSTSEVEQFVTTPLEKLLYEIDGIEYVYSMSRENEAVITVRYYVGEDRERSLVKLYKRIDEHLDIVPPGVTSWVVKPVEIDDVPMVTLTLTSAVSDSYVLRRVAEEVVERLSSMDDLSQAYVVGGLPRIVYVRLDPDRLRAYHVSPLQVQRAVTATNVTRPGGELTRDDQVIRVESGTVFRRPEELRELVVGVFERRPVFLKDVAGIVDGPAEATSYVRHGWGPARSFPQPRGAPGTTIGPRSAGDGSHAAVTIAVAKKKGTNAVWVVEKVLEAAATLKRDVIPDDVDLVITRNAGLTADEKVNDLVEALAVAIVIVIALLTIGLGWRQALIVAVAVPVVFGLTLVVNGLLGFTINRVTLFALILSLGLLVDDPIVDVENITRHFVLRRRATRDIVLEAVAEIRPPLITATLAVIASFLPMFFITGMMGPYMRPMAFNVPVTMLMSMAVAFSITPWLAYHALQRRYNRLGASVSDENAGGDDDADLELLRRSLLYRLFYPLMAPLLRSRRNAWGFLIVIGLLTAGAMGLAVTRRVPLKMLPFDNKNEFQLVLDFDEGTTLERADATVRAFEDHLRTVPEVVDFVSYVGTASPMDFNGMVRHYYLRSAPHVADIRVNLVGKKSRRQKSHALGLRLRDGLTRLAEQPGAPAQRGCSLYPSPPGCGWRGSRRIRPRASRGRTGSSRMRRSLCTLRATRRCSARGP